MDYTQRIHPSRPVTHWHLNGTGLVWRDETGRSGKVPFSAIRTVSYQYESHREKPGRYTLRLYAGPNYWLSNKHVRDDGQIEDRSRAFAAFIEQLHSELSQANPDTAYRSFTRWPVFLCRLVISLAVLVCMIGILSFAIVTMFVWLIAVMSLGLVILVPVLAQSWLHNRPHRYKPDRIPFLRRLKR